MNVKPAKGSRVSWLYRGVRTFGEVTGYAGKKGTIKGPSGGSVSRVGSKEDPVVRIKSESTGNPVLKKQSELSKAAKKSKKK